VNELEREDRGAADGPLGQDRPLVQRAPLASSSTRSTRCSKHCVSTRLTPVHSAAWPSCSASAVAGAS
jgi:hypothetical protein